MIDVVLPAVVAAFVFVSFIFVIALWQKRFDLIDPAWGLVIVAIAMSAYTNQSVISYLSVQTIVVAMVVLWATRLSLHLYTRWLRAKKEDWRYSELVKKAKNRRGGMLANMYARVYLTQGLFALVISAPVLIVCMAAPAVPSIYTKIGVVVWLVGFAIELVSDAQLSEYLRTTKDKTKLMTTGMWKYSRHPNYFGEVTMWWGMFIVALGVPNGWVSIIGPLTITFLLLFVSGIPMTESRFRGRKGWDSYKKRTSAFIPLPPKS